MQVLFQHQATSPLDGGTDQGNPVFLRHKLKLVSCQSNRFWDHCCHLAIGEASFSNKCICHCKN